MAKVTIEINDFGDTIDIQAVFDPAYNELHKSTPAQNMAGYLLKIATQMSTAYEKAQGEVTDSETDEEAQEQEEVQ